MKKKLLVLLCCMSFLLMPVNALEKSPYVIDNDVVDERLVKSDRYVEEKAMFTLPSRSIRSVSTGVALADAQANNGQMTATDKTHLYYISSQSIKKYDIVNNTQETLYTIATNNQVSRGNIVGNVFYYKYGVDNYQNYMVEGYDVVQKKVVYQQKLRSSLGAGGGAILVDKKGNIYCGGNSEITQFDKSGNRKSQIKLESDNYIMLDSFSPNEKILFYTVSDADGYWHEGFVPMENGVFTKTDYFYLFHRNRYPSWKFITENIAVNHWGEVAEFNYNSSSETKRSYTLIYSQYLSSSRSVYSIPADAVGNDLYLGNDNGEIVVFDISTRKLKKNYNIGSAKSIQRLFINQGRLYIIYDEDSSRYTMSISLSDMHDVKTITINTHHTLNRTSAEVKQKYTSMQPKHDYSQSIFSTNPSTSSPYKAGALKSTVQKDILNQINLARYLTGINALTLNSTYMERNQKGAVILAANSKLSHYPSKPSDMDDAFYKEARAGVNASYDYSGNVAHDYSVPGTIKGYLDDTANVYANNIGHRESLLDVDAVSTSFGYAPDKKYSGYYYNATSIYVDRTSDHGNTEDFYAWPASGYMPVEMINPRAMWSIRYMIDIDPKDVKIVLTYNKNKYVVDDVYYDNDYNTVFFALPTKFKEAISDYKAIFSGITVNVSAEGATKTDTGDIINISYPIHFINGGPTKVTSVKITPKNLEMGVGLTNKLTVSVNPPSVTDKSYTFDSSSSGAFTIDSKGVLTAHKAGTYTVYAKSASGIYGYAEITIKNNRNTFYEYEGNTYYYDGNGNLVKGWKTINGEKYYFNNKGIMQKGITEIGGKKYFLGVTKGKMMKGWLNYNNKTYYMNPNTGVMAKGVTKVDGKPYFFGITTNRLMYGWINYDGKKYYADLKTGILKSNITTIDNKTYFFGITTYKMMNYRFEYNKKTYYPDLDGTLHKGWHHINGDKYYFEDNYSMKRGIHVVDGKKYFFGVKFGKVMYGWINYNNEKYYSDPKSGILQSNVTIIDNVPYFFGISKNKLMRGRFEYNGKSYYPDSNGVLYQGWKELDGETYYFNQDYTVQKGITEIDGKKYFLGVTKGKMMKGWLNYDNKTYYMDPTSGVMAQGVTVIDEKPYFFGITSNKLMRARFDYEGKTYAPDKNGVLQTGFVELDNNTYYFSPTEYIMVKGGIYEIDGKKYFLGVTTGKVMKGWIHYNNKTYYTDPTTKELATGETIIDGISYTFDENEYFLIEN